MMSKDDVSDNNSTELCYYAYVIKICVQKNNCTLTRCFREKKHQPIIVTIMEGEEDILCQMICFSVLIS